MVTAILANGHSYFKAVLCHEDGLICLMLWGLESKLGSMNPLAVEVDLLMSRRNKGRRETKHLFKMAINVAFICSGNVWVGFRF